MFFYQVPTAHRQTRFSRVVDVLLSGVRVGQVHASDALVRFFLSRLVVREARSPGVKHSHFSHAEAPVSSTGTASARHRALSWPRNAVLDRRSSNGGTPFNIICNLWKDVCTLDIDGFIAQKRAHRWPGSLFRPTAQHRDFLCVPSMLWWDHPATTCSYDLRSLNIPPVKGELVGNG